MNTQTTTETFAAPIIPAIPNPTPSGDRYLSRAWAAIGALIANGDIVTPDLDTVDQADNLDYAVATAASALIAVDTGDPKRMAWGIVGTLIGAGILPFFEISSLRGATDLKLAVDTVAEVLKNLN